MRQRDAEHMMAKFGEERERSKHAHAIETSRFSTTRPGRYLLREAVEKLARRIQEWCREVEEANRPGVGHQALQYLELFDPRVSALLACRVVIDKLCQKSVLFTSLSDSIGQAHQDELRYNQFKESDRGLWELTLRENAYSSMGNLRRHTRIQMKKNAIKFLEWPRKDRIRLGSLLLQFLQEETGMVETEKRTVWNAGRPRTLFSVHPSAEVSTWIEKSAETYATLFPMWMPCVIPPAPWTSVTKGGYHTDEVPQYALIRSRDGRYPLDEAGDIPEVLAAVNAAQRTAWQINSKVLEVLKHNWEHDFQVAELPSQSDLPIPEAPEDKERGADGKHTPEFIAWVKQRHAIKDQNIINRTKRMELSRTLFVVNRFVGKRIWFPHHLDFRGRLYPTCSGIQPQGNDLQRGLLRFAEGKLLDTWEAQRWFMVQGANTWGEDKCSFEDRVAWVESNHEAILEVARDPMSCNWWTEADKPWQFLAWCLEYGEWFEQGDEFESHLPVSVDGSNNGLQIFSMLLRDERGARATNVVPGDYPEDVYQEVADAATGSLFELDKPWNMARKWLRFGGLDRKATKRQTMTVVYGVTEYSSLHYLAEWYREELKTGKQPVGQGEAYPELIWLNKVVTQAQAEVVAAAHHAMTWLRTVADICSRHDVRMRWRTPSGFLVVQSYENYDRKRIKTAAGDRLNFRDPNGKLNARRQRNGISPNFVHSLDASALARTINLCPDLSLMLIHDSFGTHAADVERLQACIRQAYLETLGPDRLVEFRDQIEGQLPAGVELPELPTYGALDPSVVLDSPYFFS